MSKPDPWSLTIAGRPEIGARATRRRTTSMRDVELFAEMTGDRNPLHFDAALADYQEQRDAASLEVFENTDAIASFDWDLAEVRSLHEALARSMAREVKLLLVGA